MLCEKCSNLALFQKFHSCVNCNRLCNYTAEKWCRYCSELKGICAVCGRKMQQEKGQAQTSQIQNVHPSFHTGGCRSCGSRH